MLGVCLSPALGFFRDFTSQHGLPVAHSSPVCASWVSALIPSTLAILSQEPCTKAGGRGTAERLWKEWLGSDTKSHYPEVKYVTSLLNVDSLGASRRKGGYLLLEILKFWES